VGVRAHTGEVSTVYLMEVDIETLVRFLSQKCVTDTELSGPSLPAKNTVHRSRTADPLL
jgi:hypothetical protein